VTKPKKMRWAAWNGEMRNAYGILLIHHEGKRLLRRLSTDNVKVHVT
jgi:hypothetical protein